jgi:hypothetical protein
MRYERISIKDVQMASVSIWDTTTQNIDFKKAMLKKSFSFRTKMHSNQIMTLSVISNASLLK